jgi:hypothetical protein
MKSAFALTLLLALAGCRATVAPVVASAPQAQPDYVDFTPGSRLRIVAAITKSGKSEVAFEAARQEGNVITMKGDDLIGYETAFWSLDPRPGGGVSLKLASATLTVNGNPANITQPTRALLHLPRSARYLRAFYLTRQSRADHNMAIAGMSRRVELEAFTRAFRESPEQACTAYQTKCEWVPTGVAVRHEVPKMVDGALVWPAQ